MHQRLRLVELGGTQTHPLYNMSLIALDLDSSDRFYTRQDLRKPSRIHRSARPYASPEITYQLSSGVPSLPTQ